MPLARLAASVSSAPRKRSTSPLEREFHLGDSRRRAIERSVFIEARVSLRDETRLSNGVKTDYSWIPSSVPSARHAETTSTRSERTIDRKIDPEIGDASAGSRADLAK